jgi:hypothetical protein
MDPKKLETTATFFACRQYLALLEPCPPVTLFHPLGFAFHSGEECDFCLDLSQDRACSLGPKDCFMAANRPRLTRQQASTRNRDSPHKKEMPFVIHDDMMGWMLSKDPLPKQDARGQLDRERHPVK